jgi:acyl transferase domain-containing protein
MDDIYYCLIQGINPQLLKGQRTGVFVASNINDTQQIWFFNNPQEGGYGLTGCTQSMFANQISYWLGVTGEFVSNAKKKHLYLFC